MHVYLDTGDHQAWLRVERSRASTGCGPYARLYTSVGKKLGDTLEYLSTPNKTTAGPPPDNLPTQIFRLLGHSGEDILVPSEDPTTGQKRPLTRPKNAVSNPSILSKLRAALEYLSTPNDTTTRPPSGNVPIKTIRLPSSAKIQRKVRCAH